MGKDLRVAEILINIQDDIDLNFINSFEKKVFILIHLIFKKKINNWLLLMNNNGFPFAEFEFINSTVNNSKIELDCHLIKGPYVVIDTIINPELNKKEWNLISNVTGIKKGSAFNLNSVYELSEKLENTGYIKELKSAAYEFVDDLASIYTYAQPISKNSLNGLLGIQPLEDGKVQFTGNVSLNFLNSLNYGEQLKINWRRMFNASQNLITDFKFPYIFNSDFQISGGIDMIKKDSSFFNLNSNFILEYLIKNNLSLGALISNNNSTNLIGKTYNSTSVNSFGFTFNSNQQDSRINPTRGYSISSDLSYGWKQTYNLDTSQSNNLRTPNFYGNLNFNNYFKVKKGQLLSLVS